MTTSIPFEKETPAVSSRPFHVMVKPMGPACNIACTYCFYLEKSALFARDEKWKMSDEVAETFVRDYIAAQPKEGTVTFAWQGGEPTLCGLPFFEKIVGWQKKYGPGRTIENAIQTNATRLNDDWAKFFKRENFLVGVSIDGPKKIHDAYRVDRTGKGTFEDVMRGIRFLQKHEVEFNTLTCVHRMNVGKGEEVYRFLRGIGSTFLQFIPIVERQPNAEAKALGLQHAVPEPVDKEESEFPAEVPGMSPWSVPSEAYGDFLLAIFNRWVRNDVGRIFIQIFDMALGKWMGIDGGLCVFDKTCGRAIAMEHDGSLYSCDHYVYPDHKIGVLGEASLASIVDQPKQVRFGEHKTKSLPKYCRECPVLFTCQGGCPKQRFIETPDGEAGLNYLCSGYRKFFTRIDPYMRVMADMNRRQIAPASIVTWLKGAGREAEKSWGYPLSTKGSQ